MSFSARRIAPLRPPRDDFGSGYSSLAYLKRFPLTALKIDRSFVQDIHRDPDAAPIVEAIIALARKLKLDIVAERVEHEDQRNFLVGGGCGTLQGYLLGRPMPIWCSNGCTAAPASAMPESLPIPNAWN